MNNSIENLFQIVLRNSEDATRAIEQTKLAIQQNNETQKTAIDVLQKVASTNEKQTVAITSFISDKEKLNAEKEAIDTKYQMQIDAIVKKAEDERRKLMRYIIIMVVVIFILLGGSTVLEKLQSLGLLKIFTGV